VIDLRLQSQEELEFEAERKNFMVRGSIRHADVDAAIILKRTLCKLYAGDIHAEDSPTLCEDGASIYDLNFYEN
jgi:hypothetical protein